MAEITINYSKTIFVEGDVSINNGLLFVNGDLFLSLKKFLENKIVITIDGDLNVFTIDSCNSLCVNGNVQSVKMEKVPKKASNDKRFSFGQKQPFLSQKFTEKNIGITINGDLESLTVETCKSLQINGKKASLQG